MLQEPEDKQGLTWQIESYTYLNNSLDPSTAALAGAESSALEAKSQCYHLKRGKWTKKRKGKEGTSQLASDLKRF